MGNTCCNIAKKEFDLNTSPTFVEEDNLKVMHSTDKTTPSSNKSIAEMKVFRVHEGPDKGRIISKDSLKTPQNLLFPCKKAVRKSSFVKSTGAENTEIDKNDVLRRNILDQREELKISETKTDDDLFIPVSPKRAR